MISKQQMTKIETKKVTICLLCADGYSLALMTMLSQKREKRASKSDSSEVRAIHSLIHQNVCP